MAKGKEPTYVYTFTLTICRYPVVKGKQPTVCLYVCPYHYPYIYPGKGKGSLAPAVGHAIGAKGALRLSNLDNGEIGDKNGVRLHLFQDIRYQAYHYT